MNAVNRPDVVAEVLGQFARYETALVTNDVAARARPGCERLKAGASSLRM